MTRKTLVTTLALTALAAIAGTYSGRSLRGFRDRADGPTQAAATGLYVPPERLGFGEVWEQPELAFTVPVENRGPTRLEVNGYSSSCNCLQIEPQMFALDPGGRQELHLRIDLTKQVSDTGEAAIRVRPQLKPGGQAGPEWVMRGHVRRALSVARNAHLGRHSEFAQPIPPLTMPIDAAVPLAGLSADGWSPGVVAAVRPVGGTRYLLTLTPDPGLPLGDIEGTVTLKPVHKTGEVLPPVQITVRGSIVSDVEAVPSVVQVGSRGVGDAFEEAVTVRSLTGRPFRVVGFEPAGDGLVVEQAGGGDVFRVRQVVRRAGSQRNWVRFRVRSSDIEVAVVVPVEFVGMASP